jgi:polygalacturonase
MLLLAAAVAPSRALQQGPAGCSVRSFGAIGDGKAVDSDAIDKAIVPKRARAATLRDFSILTGGHFALHAPGVDTLAIDNLERISSFSVSSPNRDAIVLESSDALGQIRADVFDLNVRNVTGVADGRHGHIAAGTLPYQPQ